MNKIYVKKKRENRDDDGARFGGEKKKCECLQTRKTDHDGTTRRATTSVKNKTKKKKKTRCGRDNAQYKYYGYVL